MIFHLVVIIMLAAGPEYSVSGALESLDDCRERAQVIVSAYPRGSILGVDGYCIPGYSA
jgi:hypothetical protein